MNIRLEGLTRTYPAQKRGTGAIHAVHAVSLDIPSKGIFGIIGKSGAGKSTLVRLMSLLEKPDAGAVYYDGQRVDSLTEAGMRGKRRRNGMIFQNFGLFSSRNARENIAYPLEVCGKSRREIAERTAELLDLVGLSGRGTSPISTLSGGQKQRIAIARALANNPDILFCDEATSALDPQTTRSILELIRLLKEKLSLTVVMITHQMEVVRDTCDFVAVLDNGEVAETGTVEGIFTHPQVPVTRDFLSHLAPESALGPGDAPELVRWSKEGGKYLLRFHGPKTGEPVMSTLARRFDVSFNIRAGGVQRVGRTDVGTLVTDITGPEADAALAHLRDQGILVEELADAVGVTSEMEEGA